MNSLKNVTVPLTSNLNMNRNKSLTCSSYDILNGINAPVFGGSISPLHYKIDYQGDAKYSVDGERWTVEDNKLYRGGLLFKDFSSTKSFEMIDTKLDMDAMVPYSDYFVGIKVQNNQFSWYKIDSEFRITANGVVSGFWDLDRFRGFRLTVRDGTVFLLYGYDSLTNTGDTPSCIRVCSWNGNGFTQRSELWFAFRQPTSTDACDTVKRVTNFNSVASWFFTMSKSISVDGVSKYGISVFRSRPNGTNTFKNVVHSTFLVNRDGGGIQAIYLSSGSNVTEIVKWNNDSAEWRSNRRMHGFFVDNTILTMAVGYSSNTKDWSYAKMYSSFTYGGHIDGSLAGFPALFPIYSNSDRIPHYPLMEAITVLGNKSDFAQISSLGSSCLTVNTNGYARLVLAGFGNSGDEKLGCTCVNELYDAALYEQSKPYGSITVPWCGQRMDAGVTSNASIPTTENGWNSWWKNRAVSDNTCWNPAGMRISIGNGFYALLNGREGNLAGVSYATSEDNIGTLLTAWGSPVLTFEPCSVGDKVIYKDTYSNTVKYIKVKSGITLDDIEVVGHYLLVRCSANENIYDISQDKWAKFANDWNNRALLGYEPFTYVNEWINGQIVPTREYWYMPDSATAMYGDTFSSSASWAAGYDVAFQKEKGFAPSRLYNYTSLSGVVGGEVFLKGAVLTDENGLDFFFSPGTSSPAYKCTFFGNKSSSVVSNLAGGVYPITSSGSAYFNIPIIESTVVDSYNGKYGLKIDGSVYTIAYDGIRPIALYNTSSIVDQVDDFFIVQSQYYALINGYICSLSYSSSNVISGVEQIVNVQGMKFIGAFPSCAYFYSPSARAIFAFTGDADLQLFVQTDRITEVYNSKYYPNCEWIFLSTNDGLYVMTQNNTFRIDAMNVKRFFPTDDEYCVIVLDNETNDNIFISMNRYSGWNTMPVVLETSFFGDGDMKKSTITDWYIRVFKGDEDYNGTVKCSAKTLTDIVSQVVKTFDGIKEEKLTKDKFDENDNAQITFHVGCNALGTSCKVVSDYPICYFGFTIGTDGATNKSKINI